MPQFAAIIPAAGSSARFGLDKLKQVIGGQSVLDRSIAAFLNRHDVEIVIVARSQREAHLATSSSRIMNCVGGATRAETVLAALKLVPESIEWVAIHDAARPLISQLLIDQTVAAAVEYGCAVPALPVNLTLKLAPLPLPSDVLRTVPRNGMWAMQTPQIMRRDALLKAFAKCPIPLSEITDDAQLIELAGGRVRLVPGDERNLKITTPLDLTIAKAIIEST